MLLFLIEGQSGKDSLLALLEGKEGLRYEIKYIRPITDFLQSNRS